MLAVRAAENGKKRKWMMTKTVFVTVRLEYSDTFDQSEIIENMDYDFVYEDAIQLTEIVEVMDND